MEHRWIYRATQEYKNPLNYKHREEKRFTLCVTAICQAKLITSFFKQFTKLKIIFRNIYTSLKVSETFGQVTEKG